MTSPSSDIGGAEKSFWFLSSKLREDEQFEIYGAFPKGRWYPKLKLNFKEVQPLFCIEFIPRGLSPFSILRWPLYVLTLAVNFLLCIGEILLKKIDLVYVNSSIQLSAVLAAILTGRKLVVFLPEDYFYNNLRLRKWLFILLSKAAHRLLCQSSKLEKDLKYLRGKVRVIYAGAYEIEEQQSNEIKSDPLFFKVGIIGKIYPLKGQETFVKAIQCLVQEGWPVKGYILGGYRRFSNNYFYYKKLKRLIDRQGLKDRVIFAGPASLQGIYQGLDAVAIASESEGFCLVYPEALKFGRPVISTRTGVMADVGRDGENLLFFNYGEDRQLAEKIKKLYLDKELYSKIVQNGQNTYRTYFQEDLIARQFIQTITEVAHAHRV